MAQFTLTFKTDTAAADENGLAAEVEYVLKRVAQYRGPDAAYPLEVGVSEKGRVLGSNGTTIGEWEYTP